MNNFLFKKIYWRHINRAFMKAFFKSFILIPIHLVNV